MILNEIQQTGVTGISCLNTECINMDLSNGIALACKNILCSKCCLLVKSNGTKRINCSKCEIKHNVASYFEKLENASQSLIENVSNYTNCLSKVDLVNVDLKNVKINQKSKISNINKIDLDSKLFVNSNTSIKCDYCKNVYKSIAYLIKLI